MSPAIGSPVSVPQSRSKKELIVSASKFTRKLDIDIYVSDSGLVHRVTISSLKLLAWTQSKILRDHRLMAAAQQPNQTNFPCQDQSAIRELDRGWSISMTAVFSSAN